MEKSNRMVFYFRGLSCKIAVINAKLQQVRLSQIFQTKLVFCEDSRSTFKACNKTFKYLVFECLKLLQIYMAKISAVMKSYV